MGLISYYIINEITVLLYKFFLIKWLFCTAFDASIKLLEVVETHKNLEKIESDFLNFKCENIFDGIWASFSLQHLPKKNFKTALKILINSLSETGFFYIGIHEGNKEIRDNLGRYYSYYSESEIDGIIQRYINQYPDIKVIVTGGNAKFFEKGLKNTIFAKPNLLMEGLNEILDYNESYF